MNHIRQSFDEMAQVLAAFSTDENFAKIQMAADRMVACLQAGGKLMSCGNGGSMADAMHFAEELSGRYREDRPPVAAISIADPTHISCVGNDYGYEHIFSRYIQAVGRSGDVLLAISTSGNSANVLAACRAARERGIAVVGLTGKDGGKMAALVDVEIRVPHMGYADRIQEVHIKVIHTLMGLIEQGLFGK